MQHGSDIPARGGDKPGPKPICTPSGVTSWGSFSSDLTSSATVATGASLLSATGGGRTASVLLSSVAVSFTLVPFSSLIGSSDVALLLSDSFATCAFVAAGSAGAASCSAGISTLMMRSGGRDAGTGKA
jgi:hypothetical protein